MSAVSRSGERKPRSVTVEEERGSRYDKPLRPLIASIWVDPSLGSLADQRMDKECCQSGSSMWDRIKPVLPGPPTVKNPPTKGGNHRERDREASQERREHSHHTTEQQWQQDRARELPRESLEKQKKRGKQEAGWQHNTRHTVKREPPQERPHGIIKLSCSEVLSLNEI